jgi:subtilisin-like proprotein convertase family protein
MSMLSRHSASLLAAGVILLGSTAAVSAGTVTYTKTAQQTLADATGGAGPHTAATTTSTLTVSVPGSLGQIVDVDARVRITHTNLRQLRVVLVAPNGASVTLIENGINTSGTLLFGTNNATGANLQDTWFDQDTLRPITNGAAPYSARFEASMASLEQKTPAQLSGNWELRVTDYRSGDTGTLVSWSITLKSADAPQVFTVTNLSDTGAGSLRDAVTKANARAGNNTIQIDPALTGFITLSSGPIEIIDSNVGSTIIDLGDPRRVGVVGANNRVFIVSAGDVDIRNMHILHGFAGDADGGGAIFNVATLTVENCSLRGNIARITTGPAHGGAIANLGELIVERCTFTGNSAPTGAAIYTARGRLLVTTCTLNANGANYGSDASGGAIHAASGDLNVVHSTISGNDSTGKGGGITSGPSVGISILRNVIVAGNTALAGPDLHGEFELQGGVIGNNSDATFTPNSGGKIGTAAAPIDPQLNPIANNGGLTDTMATRFGSPALDSGNCPAAVGLAPIDQRGVGTVDLLSIGTSSQLVYACDCGSFELSPAVFANIATRLPVETGENVLIAGFIVNTPFQGPTTNVIVRGIGPSLQAAGLTGTLSDPVLELYNNSGLVVTNNNWRDSQQQEIQATGIPPASDLEAAVVRRLDPASYTAILRGNNGGTGLGLVELYDLEKGGAIVANISTRGFVRTGQNVMIGGFILVGLDPAKILLRGIGPSLSAAGVQQPLQNPYLELFDGQGTKIAQNDNWQETQENVIAATGAAPSNPAESAILITLQPGSYTAIVSGVGGGTGVGLVEAYNIR